MSSAAISTVNVRHQPPALPRVVVDFENIPSELKERPQWVCWRYIERDGKPTKCPFNARTGEMASSTDPSTWSTFDEAIAAWRQDPRHEGIGFVFAADDPFCGVDLDEMDITKADEVAACFYLHQPDIVIHTAAMTYELACDPLYAEIMTAKSHGVKTRLGFCKPLISQRLSASL